MVRGGCLVGPLRWGFLKAKPLAGSQCTFSFSGGLSLIARSKLINLSPGIGAQWTLLPERSSGLPGVQMSDGMHLIPKSSLSMVSKEENLTELTALRKSKRASLLAAARAEYLSRKARRAAQFDSLSFFTLFRIRKEGRDNLLAIG